MMGLSGNKIGLALVARRVDYMVLSQPTAHRYTANRDYRSLPHFDGSVDGAVQNMILLFNPRWRDCIINFLFSSVVFGLVRIN